MDAKLQILKDTFQNRFSIDNYLRFSREFFGNIKIISPDKENTSIPLEYRYMVAAYTHAASYQVDKDVLDIFAVKLNAGRSVERARSMQRSFISKLLTAANHDGAIVAFYTDNEPRWRLSYIRLDYEFAAGRAKMSLTPAKRYSYLVGEKEPCHTAMEQLYPIFRDESFNPTLDKIEEAFSVERVTQEFFDKYKEKYFILKEHLDGDDVFRAEAQRHGFTSEQFAKKLMGQLAFLYFLQKKGWLGVKVLPHVINEKTYKNAYYRTNATKEVIPKIYKQTGADEYKLVVSALLNLSDAEADAAAGSFKSEGWGSGTKTFIRDLYSSCKYKNFFEEYLEPLFYEALNQKRGENSYYKRFNCRIPFLNGGLFEPLENYDWVHCKFSIPNTLFSNIDTKGERDADGILDIFDRYNFTMNEDEPLEREVAVDPEMLGKIFENLLDAKDRKSKGAFYTPREIVHYMCAESLINYLIGKTGVPYEDIKSFITDGEFMKDEDYNKRGGNRKLPQTVYENLRIIDEALKNIKVADPAVGSGAFPLGMLSEIVKARNNITYYFASEFDKAEDRARLFEQRDMYRLKWDTIQNSIFAVDIEASAVDIAKLRLWLSLVVDENLDPTFDEQRIGNVKEKDPRPLPNLDYNIMCGNSLVDEFDGIKLFDDSILGKGQTSKPGTGTQIQMSLFMDSMQMFLDDLRREQERLFGEQNPETKHEIKRHIDKIIDDIIRAKLTKDNNTEGLKKYEESLKQKTKPYFLWKLEFAKVFRENSGFDVVIGNPPYVDSENMVKNMPEMRILYSRLFATAKGNWDLYIPFWENAVNLLNSNGTAAFISPNKWLAIKYGEELRKFLFEYIYNISDFSTFKAFETADISTVVVFATKMIKDEIMAFNFNDHYEIVHSQRVNREHIRPFDNLSLCISSSFSTLSKLLAFPVLSKRFSVNEAATVSETYEIAKYLHDYATNPEIDIKECFKFINTGTIDKYESLWGKEAMTYVKEKYFSPVIYRTDLQKNFKRRFEQASAEKIITTGIRYFEAFYDEKGEYLAAKSTVIIRAIDKVPLRAILPILNSNLVFYFLKEAYSGLAMGGGVNFTANNLNKIPLPMLTNKETEVLINYSRQIEQCIASEDADKLIDLFDEIDCYIYNLYNLNEDDIKILEIFKVKSKRKR